MNSQNKSRFTIFLLGVLFVCWMLLYSDTTLVKVLALIVGIIAMILYIYLYYFRLWG
jgi:hypothetical protein